MIKKILKISLLSTISLMITSCPKNSSESDSSENKKETKVSFTGSFRSIKAVMNPLSCYCFNGGYLTTADNKTISICIPNEEEKVSCPDKVTFEGVYETKEVKYNPQNPCPAGKMTYLKVTSTSCN